MNFNKYFVYCPVSGHLYWKKRDRSEFKTALSCKTWNTRFSNKVAGYESESTASSSPYIKIQISGKNYYAHRIAMSIVGFSAEGLEVDHINGNGLDNRLLNLRVVSSSENSKNLATSGKNSSGKIGVFFCNDQNKWRAIIHHERKKIHLGCFDSFRDACLARSIAEHKYKYTNRHGSMLPSPVSIISS